MQTRQKKWKRRLFWAAFPVLAVVGILAALAFNRFYFSNQAFPRLARLQGNHPTNLNLDGTSPVIIGHRGSGLASTRQGLLIGNTANAIHQAVDAGVNWIEIDIRASSDGRLVVFHDETIDLKTTGTGAVSDLDLSQLQAADVLVDPTEKILSLDEVFARFHAPGRKWVLDIKATGIKNLVLSWVAEHLSKENVTLFGTYEVLQEYKDGGYSLGYTAIWKNADNRLRVLFEPSAIIRRCEMMDCDYLVLPVIFANPVLINEARARQIDVWVYGTDNELDLRYLAGSGVTGFIIDRPRHTAKLFRNGEIKLKMGTDDHESDRTR